MNRMIIVTGANGHLGQTIIRRLVERGERVRGLVLANEETSDLEKLGVELVQGDVRELKLLRPLFEGITAQKLVIIHAAAIIDITSKVSSKAYEVNVIGTQNMVQLALEHHVYRFIHLSSVHAMPEAPGRREMKETKDFNPNAVRGGYAKTKAEATRYVMNSVREKSLPAIIIQPSGIVGPGDKGTNNLVAAIKSYYEGKRSACPRGGYNLVDVRDVAAAVIKAIDHGRVGEPYILSGKHYEFKDIFEMIQQITGRAKKCLVLPAWLVKLIAPLMEWNALRKSKKPLVTRYSIEILNSNDNYKHEKASRELDFWPRDFYTTLEDTLFEIEKKVVSKPKRLRGLI